MFYNLKMVQYPNGSVQMRFYDSPMKCKEFNPYEKEYKIINPFTVEYVKKPILTEFPFEKVITPEEKELYIEKSVGRSKNKICEYARCCFWEYFVTVTFNEKYIDRYDYSECSKALRKWLDNQKQRYSRELKYLFVPEQHKKGGWHFHGLLADVGNMQFKDSGHTTTSDKVIYNMSKWNYGFTTAIRVDDTHGISKYITKYITKEVCCSTPHQQRYFVSRNLPIPQVSTFAVPDIELEDFIREMADSLGISVVSETDNISNEWIGVKYFELQ